MAYIGSTPSTQSFQPAVDYFSGDGTTYVFTLSRVVYNTTQVQVVVNNVIQNPGTAFSILNNTITFTSVPSAGSSNIYVYYTSQINAQAINSAASATGGATGGGTDTIFIQNSNTMNSPYTIPAGLNAHSIGPITVANSAVITLTNGSRWVVY